jgi:hypothetical protein
MLPLHSPPGVNTLYCVEEWRGKHRISPSGDNFTLRGQSSSLGAKVHPWGPKFAPRAKFKVGPKFVKREKTTGLI